MLMLIRRLLPVFWIGLLFVSLLVGPALAQDQTYLSLQTDTTALQTGQEYAVRLRVDGAPAFWMVSAVIEYDPALIYVMGTKAGSPVTIGSMFSGESSTTVRNFVNSGRLEYTASQLAPADLISGSGELGVFRIYPLAPGTTTLRFYEARLTTITFSGEGENRQASDPSDVPFAPVLLELTITGDPVEPPSEATATPTLTPTPFLDVGGDEDGPSGPGLENVTMVPTTPAAPSADTATAQDTDDDSNTTLLLIVAGVAIIGVILLAALLLVARSRRT
jgi:hypothetical protein